MVQPIELSWKDTRLRVEMDTYTGDGGTGGRTISLGFAPSLVVVMRDDVEDMAVCSNSTNYLHLDSISALTEAAERTDLQLSGTGFVVGNGDDRFNTSATDYLYLAFGLSGEVRLSWKNTLERIEFGQYTGDGVTTGREIDVGFPADMVFVQTDGSANFWYTMNGTTSAQAAPGLGTVFQDENAVHTSANGFTVGDGNDDGNQNTVTYNYVALQLSGDIRIAWKNDLLRSEAGTYVGDGTDMAGGRLINLGFAPDWVFVQEDNDPRSWVFTSIATGTGLQLSPGLSNNVQKTTGAHYDANGFVVGDGAGTANSSGVTYNYFAVGVV